MNKLDETEYERLKHMLKRKEMNMKTVISQVYTKDMMPLGNFISNGSPACSLKVPTEFSELPGCRILLGTWDYGTRDGKYFEEVIVSNGEKFFKLSKTEKSKCHYFVGEKLPDVTIEEVFPYVLNN